jgi:hypothetical protein
LKVEAKLLDGIIDIVASTFRKTNIQEDIAGKKLMYIKALHQKGEIILISILNAFVK